MARIIPQLLSVVITDSGPRVALVNLNFNLVYQVATRVTVQRIDMALTTPEGHTLPFNWHVFYDFQPSSAPACPVMTKVCDADAFESEAGSRALGIQFSGPMNSAHVDYFSQPSVINSIHYAHTWWGCSF